MGMSTPDRPSHHCDRLGPFCVDAHFRDGRSDNSVVPHSGIHNHHTVDHHNIDYRGRFDFAAAGPSGHAAVRHGRLAKHGYPKPNRGNGDRSVHTAVDTADVPSPRDRSAGDGYGHAAGGR